MGTYLYAILAGFIVAAPIGVAGAACAMAAMQKRHRDAWHLVAGVLTADAIMAAIITSALLFFPYLNWHDVKGWWFIWAPAIVLLGIYGLSLLIFPTHMAKTLMYPKNPFRMGLLWDLAANPKNWLGTFTLYMGWHVLGLMTTPLQTLAIVLCTLFGGLLSWTVWIILCRRARKWRTKAEIILQRGLGALCLLAAASAAITLLVQ
jgi:threonine/homoserine/homoserine lactone efflux protein